MGDHIRCPCPRQLLFRSDRRMISRAFVIVTIGELGGACLTHCLEAADHLRNVERRPLDGGNVVRGKRADYVEAPDERLRI